MIVGFDENGNIQVFVGTVYDGVLIKVSLHYGAVYDGV